MRSAFFGVDVGPVFVDDVADAGPRRGDDVGAGQDVEPAAAGEIADVHAEGARRIADVDVPVVAAAVDVDVAEDRFGGAGRVVAADVEQAQDRLGGVPFLAQGGLGALDGVAGQLPVAVQPVRIAHHDDDAILAVAGRQILGHLGRQVARGNADVVLAALDLLLGGGSVRGIAGGGGLRRSNNTASAKRLPRSATRGMNWGGCGFTRAGGTRALGQGRHQLVLGHAVPAGNPLLAGQVQQCLFGAGLQLIASHALPLPRRSDEGRHEKENRRSRP